MLPGCTRDRHFDEATGREYDFCSRRHAEQYKVIHGTCKAVFSKCFCRFSD